MFVHARRRELQYALVMATWHDPLVFLFSSFLCGVAASACGAVDVVCDAGHACGCEGAGSCEQTCDGAGCDFYCEGAGSCEFYCEEGGCDAHCDGEGSCMMSCPGNGCTLVCEGIGSCELIDCEKDCSLTCRTIGSCEQTCEDPSCVED